MMTASGSSRLPPSAPAVGTPAGGGAAEMMGDARDEETRESMSSRAPEKTFAGRQGGAGSSEHQERARRQSDQSNLSDQETGS